MKSIFVIASYLLCCTTMLAKDIVTTVTPDSVRVLRNPLNGWVMYVGRTWDADFWTKYKYDDMPTSDGINVRVSDYANTCYVRTSWSSLEPEEGKYAWHQADSRLMRMLNSARERQMKLAFRIVVDGRDQGQNTPLYVFKAGAKGFTDPNNPKVMCPYPDDSVFQVKYTKFLEAFAKEFNDPDKVDFIDAYGLGKWGEAHAVRYANYNNKLTVFRWITSLYGRTFSRVPLVINYHRLVGDTLSWAAPSPDSEQLLQIAIDNGYSLRHDAFGMTGYYQEWEKSFASRWRFQRPIIMEGGWITGAHHRYWIDPSGAYRENHSEDVRRGEYEASAMAHVNMMDLRVNDETRSWFGKSFDLVRRFVSEGGYRLFPSKIVAPDRCRHDRPVVIRYEWNNMGWGYCPTNIPQWNQKYKVGIALVDGRGTPVKIWVDEQTDLSTWLKGKSSSYVVELDALPKGNYRWAVSLVDKTKGNTPGLQMAVAEDRMKNGWLILNKVTIK